MSGKRYQVWIPPLGLAACFLIGVALSPWGGLARAIGTCLALLPLIVCVLAVLRHRKRRAATRATR